MIVCFHLFLSPLSIPLTFLPISLLLISLMLLDLNNFLTGFESVFLLTLFCVCSGWGF